MDEWLFNRGEWTEAYVFLRLLGEGRIYGADENLQRDEQAYIDVINIIKDEPTQYLRFERFVEDELEEVRAINEEDGIQFRIITAPELRERASYLYNKIKDFSAGTRKYSEPATEAFLRELRFTNPKANLSRRAKDLYGAKADVIITTEDSFDHTRAIVGFSIKSHMGSPSSLFNCSSTSGFKYEVIGCNEQIMHKLNALDSYTDIIQTIKNNYRLEYLGCRNNVFEDNISVVDSQMDKVLNCMALIQSGYLCRSVSNKSLDLCNAVTVKNPLNVRNPEFFYPAKFKDFLFDSFAGLTATTPWNGRKKLSGGYIDVSRNGDMLYYRAISDDIFSNYLLARTYIDRPDRGVNCDMAIAKGKAYLEGRDLTEDEIYRIEHDSNGKCRAKKGDFGYVYCNEGKYFIDINFQIRFK